MSSQPPSGPPSGESIADRAKRLGLTPDGGQQQPATMRSAADPAADDNSSFEEAAAMAGFNELPPNSVVFDKTKFEAYDFEAEAQAAEEVIRVVGQLKAFGVDNSDKGKWPELKAACDKLAQATAASPAPVLRDDARLTGDWELIGTTSADMEKRKGMSGLGGAMFTAPVTIFFRFDNGRVVAKEVLSFFGNPVVCNEFRGIFGFSADGNMVQERYESADIGGQKNTPGFAGATATLEGVCITADGALRLGLTPGGGGSYFVFKKLGDGERDGWLGSKGLPLEGGTGF